MSAQSPCPHCAGAHALERLSDIPAIAELFKAMSADQAKCTALFSEHAINAAQISLGEAQQVLEMFITAFEAGRVTSSQQGAVLYVVQRLLAEVSVALDQRGGV